MQPNQNPEQIAREAIDAQLIAAGWTVQAKDAIDFHAGQGQAVREYTTDSGPADYGLFVEGRPVGVIEAKKETLGHTITAVEEQTADYASAKDENPAERSDRRREPLPVAYAPKVPPEFFDVIVDAIGVTKSLKTASRQPVPFKDLATAA